MKVNVLVFMKRIVGICIVLVKTIDYEINAVANYILKKYEVFKYDDRIS